MGSLNCVHLIGNIGQDIELKYTQSGKAVCNLSIATNETWKDNDGKKRERVEWHRCIVFGDQAENCAKYLAKGRSVFVSGRIQTRKWQDKAGQDRYTTEIMVDRVTFLGGGEHGGSPRLRDGEQSEQAQEKAQQAQHREESWGGGGGNDDLPF
jgi:single-strand DNA-binding protein